MDLAINAFQYVQSNIPLKISGTGEDEAAFRELARAWRIEFLGRVDDAQLLDLYGRALVVPFVPQMKIMAWSRLKRFRAANP